MVRTRRTLSQDYGLARRALRVVAGGLGAAAVAHAFARLRDDAPVLGAQRVVVRGPGAGARGEAFGLREIALAQPHARELVPEARVARLEAQRALERRRRVGEAACSRVRARAFHQPCHRDGFAWRFLRLFPGSFLDRGGRTGGAAGKHQKEEGALHRPNSRSSQLLARFTPWSTASTTWPAALEQGERSPGAVPWMKGSSTAPAHALSPRRPFCGSIHTCSTESGRGRASGSGARFAISSPQTGSAAEAPESFAARLSS